ncbi:MAG: right-handed parallel beta-helix repeat-containing protein, partial [bacterium]|nr:right-handed parallel beta-helix repeat-containing protein [bacterium]
MNNQKNNQKYWNKRRPGSYLISLLLFFILFWVGSVLLPVARHVFAACATVTFDRQLSGDKVGQHKVPPTVPIDITVSAEVSSSVTSASLIDYFPEDWTILDAGGGTVDPVARTITWSVGDVTTTVSRSYTIFSPERTTPSTKYYFHSELHFYNKCTETSSDWMVIVADPTWYVEGNSPYLALDSNTPCVDGPEIATLSATVTNTGATTLTNATLSISFGASSPNSLILSLTSGDQAVRYIADLDPGDTYTAYWFVTYPRCDAGDNGYYNESYPYTFTFDADNATPETRNLTITSQNEISASANQINAITLSTSALSIGQTFDVVVDYTLGQIGQDGDAWLQPVGNSTFDPSMVRLIRAKATLNGISQPDNQLYFTGWKNNNVSGTVAYTFIGIGPGSTSISPYQEAASGAQQKYTGNFGGPAVTATPSFTNTLTLDKSTDKGIAPPGDTLAYTITYGNTGSDPLGGPATNSSVVIIDTIPANTTYVAGSAGSDTISATIYWSTDGGSAWVGTEPAPASVTHIKWVLDDVVPPSTDPAGSVGFQATINTGVSEWTIILNTCDIGINNGSPVGSDSTSTTVRLPDGVMISKTDGKTLTSASDTLTYTITYQNTGDAAAIGVVITDTIPTDTTFSSASDGGTESGGVVTWNIGTLDAGVQDSVTLTVVVNDTASPGTKIVNTATIADNGLDSDTTNNSQTDTDTVVNPQPDVTITSKTDGTSTASPGDTLTYTITYENIGTTGAVGVVITDVVPTNTTFSSATGGGAESGGMVTWNIGALATDGPHTATVTVVVDDPLPQRTTNIINTANIADDGSDSDPTNNFQSDVDSVIDKVDVTITSKTDGTATASPGDTLTYIITYENTGGVGANVYYVRPDGNNSNSGTGSSASEAWQTIDYAASTIGPGDMVYVAPGTYNELVTIDNSGSSGNRSYYIADTNGSKFSDISAGDVIVDVQNSRNYCFYLLGKNYITIDGFTVRNGAGTWSNADIHIANSDYIEVYNCTASGGSNKGIVVKGDSDNCLISDCEINGTGYSFSVEGTSNDCIIRRCKIHDIPDEGITIWHGSNGNYNTIVENCIIYNNEGNGGIEIGGNSDGSIIRNNTLVNNDATGYGNLNNKGDNTICFNNIFDNGANITITTTGSNFSSDYNCIRGTTSGYTPGANDLTGTNPDLDASYHLNSTSPCRDSGADTFSGQSAPSEDIDTGPRPYNSGYDIGADEYGASALPGSSTAATGVVISDTIPTNTTFVSASDTGTESGGVVTWNIGTLETGVQDSVTLTVTVNDTLPAGTANIVNTATITDDGSDLDPTNNSGTDTDSVFAQPDVIITSKTDGTATVSPGDTLTYTITYQNTGEIGATSVVITDTIPTNTTFSSASGGGTLSGDTVTWTIGTLEVDGPHQITLTVVVNDPLPGGTKIVNTATIGDDGSDSDPTNNSQTDTDTVVAPQPDVTMTSKTDGADTASPGDTLTYTITYENTGDAGAASVVITDTIPTNTTFVSAHGGSESGGVFTWNIGALDANDSGQVTLTVVVNDTLPYGTTNIVNIATIVDDGSDSDSTNNSGTDTDTVVAQPDVTITSKTDGTATALPGDTLTYTITYENTGEIGTTGGVITDTIPTNTTFASCSPGTSSQSGQVLTWNIGNLAVDGPHTITLTVVVNDTLPYGTANIVNIATIADDGSDSDVTNNSGTDTDTVVAYPDVTIISKTDGTATASPGDTLTYTITYQNTGEIGATSVVVTETIPTNTTYVSNTGGGSYSGGVVTWTIGTLEADGPHQVSVTVTVNNPLPQGTTNITNTATIADDGSDSDPANNSATDTDSVDAQPDVTITSKTDGADTASQGDTLTYTITYRNTGEMNATGVVITDTIPTNTTFVSASAPGSESGGVVTWNIGSLGVDGSHQVTLTVVIDNSLPQGTTNIVNTATIADDGSDSDATNNSGTDTTSVTVQPDVSITKTDGRRKAWPGSTLIYNITYENIGDTGAVSVVITDTVPDHTSFVSATEPYNIVSEVVTWNIGSLDANDSGQVTLTVVVDVPLAEGTDIYNTVTITDDGSDPDLSNNSYTDIDLDPQPEARFTDSSWTEVIFYQVCDNVYIEVVDEPGQDTITITLYSYDSSDTIDAETVTLTEDLVETDVYRGSISTCYHYAAAGCPLGYDNGILSVNPFDDPGTKQWIEYTYKAITPSADFRRPNLAFPTVPGTEWVTPASLNVCQTDGEFRLTFLNSGQDTAYDAVIVIDTLPDGYSYVPGYGKIISNDNPTGYAVEPDTTSVPGDWIWNYDGLDGNPIWDIASADTRTLVFALTPSCNSPEASEIWFRTYFRIGSCATALDLTGDDQNGNNFQAVSITVNQASLSLTKTAIELNGSSITPTSSPTASPGDEITWLITVSSNGDTAPLVNVEVTDTLGAGLTYVAGSSIADDSDTKHLVWTSAQESGLASIDPGDTVGLTLKTLVGCAGLSNNVSATWGCDENNDCQSTDVTAVASVTLDPQGPDLAFNPPNFNFSYCYDIDTYTITIQNNGGAYARNITLIGSGLSSYLTLTNVSPSGSYDSPSQTFTLPDLAPGDTVEITFTAAPLNGWCSWSGLQPTRIVNWTLNYYNGCNNSFSKTDSSNITISPQSTLTVTKSSNPTIEMYLGETIQYTLTVDYNGTTSCPGPSTQVSVTDTYPNGFTVLDADGGNTDTPGIITWSYTPDGVTSWVKTVLLQAPPYDECETYAQTYAYNYVYASLTDCCGCFLSDQDSTMIALEAEEFFTSERTPYATTFQKCSSIDFANTYSFDNSSVWDTVNWSDMIFYESGANNMDFVAGSLSITVDSGTQDCTISGQNFSDTTFVHEIITYYYEFDFPADCDAIPVKGSTMVITYQMQATDTSSPGCDTSYSFYDWSTLDVGVDLTGNCYDADRYIEETTYLTLQNPDMYLTVSDHTMDECDTTTVTINITKTPSSLAAYDVRVQLNMGNYARISDFSYPVGPTPTWNDPYLEYGDAFGVDTNSAQITFDLERYCTSSGGISATVYYDDLCNNDDPDSYDQMCSYSDNMVVTLQDGDLSIIVSPDPIIITADTVAWTVYAYNNGVGAIQNVDIHDTLGSGYSNMTYQIIDHTGSPAAADGYDTLAAGIHELHIRIHEIPGNSNWQIRFTADVDACQVGELENRIIQAFWSCHPTSDACETEIATPSITQAILREPSLYIKVQPIPTSVSAINICGTQDFQLIIRNDGPTYNYDVVSTASFIPGQLDYISGSAVITKNGSSIDSPTPHNPTVVPGVGLVWDLSTWGIDDLAPGDEIIINFDIDVDCSYVTSQLLPEASYLEPCGQAGTVSAYGRYIAATTPDLTVDKTINPFPGKPGPTTWTIRLFNQGNGVTDRIVVIDTLPSYMYYTGSSEPPYSGNIGDTVITWVFDRPDSTINPGSAYEFTVTATMDDCPPPASANEPNTAAAIVGCKGAGENDFECIISITKDFDASSPYWSIGGSNPDSFSVTQTIGSTTSCDTDAAWVLLFENNDEVDGKAPITIYDTLPSGVEYVSSTVSHDTGSGWTPVSPDSIDTSTQTIIWSLSSTDLAAGEKLRVDLVVRSNCGFAGGTNSISLKIFNCIGTEYTLPTDGPDTATVSDPGESDISVTKTPTDTQDPFPGRVGSSRAWTISISNSGDAATDRVVVTDTLPRYMSYASSSEGPYSVDSSGTRTVVTWVLDRPDSTVAVSGSYQFTLTANMAECPAAAYADELNEVKAVNGCRDDGDTELRCIVDTASDSDEATPYWNIGEVDSDSFSVTQTTENPVYCDTDAAWVLLFENNDEVDGKGPITIYDTLPAGVEYVSSTVSHDTGSGWTPVSPDSIDTSAPTISWTLPSGTNLDAGDKLKVDLVVRTNCNFNGGTNYTSLTLYNCLTPPEFYSLPVDGPDTQTVTGDNTPPDLSVDKFSKDTTYFAAEDTVAWTITVTNSGTPTSRTIIIDTLPDFVTYNIYSVTSEHSLNWITSPTGAPGEVLQWVTDSSIINGSPLTLTLTGDVTCNDSTTPNVVQVLTGCPDLDDTTAIKYVCEVDVESDSSTPYWQVAEYHPEDFAITQNLPAFGYCDTGTFTLTFENKEDIGDITAYGAITLTDTLPAELFYIETVSIIHTDSTGATTPITATDSPAQEAEGLLSWILPGTLDLSPGETIALTFNVGSRCDFAGGQNNVRFTAHTCFGDTYSLPAAGPDTDNVPDAAGMPNISVEKIPATFDAEGPNTWTIRLTNTGTAATDRTIVTDTLPDYVTSYSAGPTWTTEEVIGGDTVLTWVINTPIASGGGTFDINFSGTISCIHTDEANTVSVVTGCADLFDSMALYCVVNSDSDVSTPYWVLKETDISIVQTLPPEIQVCTLHDGSDSDTFVITFTNLSPAETNNESITGYSPITITDTLPQGITYVSGSTTIIWTGEADWTTNPATTGSGVAGDTQILVWTLPYNFDPQDVISVTFKIENPSSLSCEDFPELSQNTVGIRMHPCDGGDTYGFSNTSSNIQKLDPNLSITKSVVDTNATGRDPTNAWLIPGDTVAYTITVTNSGDGEARNVTITDTLSNYLHFTTESHSAGDTFEGYTGGYNDGSCSWTIARILPAGGTATVTLYATVLHDLYGDNSSEPDMPDGTVITNAAGSLTATDACCPDVVDTGALSLDVEAPYVWVEKHLINPAPPDVPSVGDLITFRIDYGNTGSSTAYDIVITDTLPGGLQYVSGGNWDGSVITFADEFIEHGSVGNPGWLDPGETASVYWQANIVSAPIGGINNIAVLDHQDDNGNPREQISDTESFSVFVLDLEKSAPATAAPGDAITFTLTIVNDSSDSISSLNLTDTLPTWVSFVSASDGGDYDTSAHTVYWLLGTIHPQSSRVVTIDVLVSETAPDQTVLQNNATLVYSGGTIDASSSTTVGGAVILEVNKHASCYPGTTCTLQPGDTFSYTIRYENIGSGIAKIIITDTLPADVTYIEDNSSYSHTNVGQVYTWPDVSSETYSAAGFTVGYFTVTVRLNDTVTLGKLFTNEVTLSYWDKGNGTFFGTLYDSLTLRTSASIPAAPIQIQKVSTTPVVNAGDPAGYILTVTNTGTSDLDNIVVRDTFPSGITYNPTYPSVPAATNSPSSGDTILVWNFTTSADLPDTLHPGESRQIQVTGVADISASGTLANQATADALDIYGVPVEQAADTTSVVVLTPTPALQIEKVTSTSVVSAGDSITYILTIKNYGSQLIDNITVTDTIPAGLDYVRSEPAHSGINGQAVSWTITSLARGEERQIQVTAATTIDDSGSYINPASVYGQDE